MELLTGKCIRSYELLDLIGKGSFGAVYRASQAVVGREVAIKIIWPTFANHPEFIRQFEAEAQLVASLEHPYIVPLYDYWREPDGAYIVMRWLRGGHLGMALDGTPWPVEKAVSLLDQLASALALAHRYGVIHRDLRPENILLDEEGNAYLADFGIAQVLNPTVSSHEAFLSLGSPAYAAPEQMLGAPVTPQTDLFSLGILLYELLAGQHPFPDLARLSQTDLITLRTQQRLPSLLKVRPDLPAALDDAIQQATEPDPSLRFPDATSLTRAVHTALRLSPHRPANGNGFQATGDTVINPYKGLRAFQEADACHFFGRKALVQRLLGRLAEADAMAHFLVLVGPSGSGKSSVLRAGVIPALRHGALPGSDHWFFVDMIPGPRPFKELERALLSIAAVPAEPLLDQLGQHEQSLLEIVQRLLPSDDPEAELFLFIDQFEEIFTLVEDSQERDLFLENLYTALLTPNPRLRVVATLRADFYDRPLLHPHMSQFMHKRTELVVPLSVQELEESIIEPAQQVGVSFDSGLVATLIVELNEQPGALPLLQYTLSELFDRRAQNTITPRAYRDIGGLRGALARRANELFDRFNSVQQEATRQLFLRLVTLGEGTEDTRRRVPLTEITTLLGDASITQTVIEELGKARLLTFDRDPVTRTPTLEIAHEAILREWQRLRLWLDDSRHDIRMQRSLTTLAMQWLEAGRDTSFLLQTSRLDRYQKWAEKTHLALTQLEQDYLLACAGYQEHQQAQELTRQQHEKALEKQAFSRLRWLVVVLCVATCVALSLMGFALKQSWLAQDERDKAEDARQASDTSAAFSRSLALAANAEQALADNDPDLAVVLALEANQISDPPIPAWRTLASIALAPGARRQFTGYTSWLTSLAISPDGQTLASGSRDSIVRVWDVETGLELLRLAGHKGDVQSVTFSPDGQYILSGAADFKAILWDTASGTEIRRFEGHTRPISNVAFSLDGRMALTAAGDGVILLWNVETGDLLRRFEQNDAIVSAAFSPDELAIISTTAWNITLWNPDSGAVIRQIAGQGILKSAAISPDGKIVISGASDGTLAAWNLETGELIRQFKGTDTEIRSIAFYPDGHTILSGAADGNLQVWDIQTGEELYLLRGHQNAILSATISPDGSLAASSSVDQTLRLWNVGSSGQIWRTQGHGDRVTSITYSETGDIVWTTSLDGTLRTWDAESGQEAHAPVNLDVPITSAAVSGQQLLLGLKDGTLQLWDLTTYQLIRILYGHSGSVSSVALNSDSFLAVSGSQDGTLIVWDLNTGQIARQLGDHSGPIHSVALSPDGHQVLAGARDSEIILWNVDTGQEIRRLNGHTEPVYSVVFSPDGQQALSGSKDTTVILWDVAAGEEITRFARHTGPVWSVAFSPDGRMALSGDADATIILWNLASTEELQRFQTDDVPFRLAFNPDGTKVVSGQLNGSLRTWRAFSSLQQLMAWTLTNRRIRELTCAERELYLITPLCPAAQ